ncbi:alpha-ketoglutarate-dependent dioxygenase AlkB [Flavobacterium sp. FlaQc-50]|uniref:alpha-ketoglutarate-dependent dioxygenase AlkB n=1 Tax=unclassified Flavobacterium TaxID=196869 RepID=UPI003756F16D
MKINSDFYRITLSLESNLFKGLFNSVDFEDTAKGRIGNHLVNVAEKGIPIVRTTTTYTIPAHNFSSIHHELIERLNDTIHVSDMGQLPQLAFNNALIEVYDTSYATMKYHSDQCLDLELDSYIGLFTCYENPDGLLEENLRQLKIKDKITDEEFSIPLTHNSVVLFSLSTNARFLHKIILESTAKKSDNKWLGITFRKSKTFVQFENGVPRFSDGELLELADENQKTEFFKLRGQENSILNFVYPRLSYTLSPGDILMPKE